MGTVTKRELNQQTSRVLESVRSEGAVIVTERGVPSWRIEAVSVASPPAQRLRDTGRVVPAKSVPAPWRDDLLPEATAGTGRTPAEVDALLAELREDERL